LEYRTLGKSGLKVSVLGFGCGAVGGIMVADDHSLTIRSVERAVEAGINYFDTAQLYGNGRSEENLGRVLQEIRPDVIVGTKTMLGTLAMDDIENSIILAAEVSLRRLKVDKLDLFQLHNPIRAKRNPVESWIGVDDLDAVQNAFHKLCASGKIRNWGINGIGDTEAIMKWVASSGAETIQVCFNLLNPSAEYKLPPDFPFQDYRQLIKRAAEREMGIIAFRVIAGGALTGSYDRHPTAAKIVEPVASSGKYTADVALANKFEVLVTRKWVGNLAEAAIRFAISQPDISTLPIGFSSLDQLEQAITAVEKGPLPTEALECLPAIWQKF
jgi:aryl-alcohol dehydrogenase-like predicted oxidoreductase